MTSGRRLALYTILIATACAHTDRSYPDIPPPSEFQHVLTSALEDYFGPTNNGEITVGYQLLRDGPTITGIAYPKYYVWVQVRSADTIVLEGVARVAAIKRSFEVTNFVSVLGIKTEPALVDSIFPHALADIIRQRAEHARTVRRRGA